MNKQSNLWVVWDGKELIWSGNGREYLRGVGIKFLKHKAFEEGFAKLLSHYKPKKTYKLLLFLPCSYGKPYSQSYIHYFIIKALKETGFYEEIHQVIVTNAGVVPRELDEYYPYVAYDWNPKYENPEIKEIYTNVLYERLKNYLIKFRKYYKLIACYLRWDSDSYKAIKLVEKELGINIPNLAPKNVPDKEIKEVSLGIYDYEEDLKLITKTALKALKNSVIKIISSVSR